MGDRKCRRANRCAVMATRVGLTGGIGSGKTTVASYFTELGVEVFDADQIGRDLTEPGNAQSEQILAQILKHFGRAIIDSDGRLKRKRLGQIAFNHPQKRKLLESILHPPILDKMLTQCRESSAPYCVLEIPLLIESGQHALMERVVVVTCNLDTRTSRLQQHRKMNVDEINRILNTQLSEQDRLAKADDVIVNDSTVDSLKQQVATLHENYRSLFAMP